MSETPIIGHIIGASQLFVQQAIGNKVYTHIEILLDETFNYDVIESNFEIIFKDLPNKDSQSGSIWIEAINKDAITIRGIFRYQDGTIGNSVQLIPWDLIIYHGIIGEETEEKKVKRNDGEG